MKPILLGHIPLIPDTTAGTWTGPGLPLEQDDISLRVTDRRDVLLRIDDAPAVKLPTRILDDLRERV